MKAAVAEGRQLGVLAQPGGGAPFVDGCLWAADNGCYGKNFNEEKWWKWLERMADRASDCLFATAPDVVGDAEATLARSLPWLPPIRALGYPAALVAQDGLVDAPWDEFDALFLGGTTEFKLSESASQLALEAHRRGKWVHMGRVNSLKRMKIAASPAFRCDSADGTFISFGPKKNLPIVLGWLAAL